MSDRTFTPPALFPAEYVTRGGKKVVLAGRMPSLEYPYFGWVSDDVFGAYTYCCTEDGNRVEHEDCIHDLCDISEEPKL